MFLFWVFLVQSNNWLKQLEVFASLYLDCDALSTSLAIPITKYSLTSVNLESAWGSFGTATPL